MSHWARVLIIDEVCKTLLPPKLLIDAGCGDCSYSLRIRANRRVGLDLNPPLKKEIETIKCDISSIPLKDAIADCIICLDVIEHVANDKRIIGEFYRILVDNGTLILTTPTESEFMPNRILRKAFKMETGTLHKEWRHLRVYSENRLISLLEDNGFQVTFTKDIYQPLTRLFEPANWYSGLRRLIHKPAKSSMDKDFASRGTKLVAGACKIYDVFFRMTLAHLVKWLERTGNDGFTHIIICKRK